MIDPSQITHGCVRTVGKNREQQRVGSVPQKLTCGYIRAVKIGVRKMDRKKP